MPSVDKTRRTKDGGYWTRIHWYSRGVRQPPVTVRAASQRELDAAVDAECGRLTHEIHLAKTKDGGDPAAVGEVMTCADLVWDWIELYVAVELSGSTPREYAKDAAEWFIPFWGDTTLAKVTRAQGLAWRKWLRDQICSAGNSRLGDHAHAGHPRVNRLLVMGQSIFSFAVDNEWIEEKKHPLKKVKPLKYSAPPESAKFNFIPELAEAIRLVIAEIAPQHRADPLLQMQARCAVSCFAYLGLAQQDLFDARFTQALHDDGTPRNYFEVHRRPDGSGNKTENRDRDVLMPQQVKDEIVSLWHARGCPSLDDLIVPNGEGKAYSRQNWQRDFWRPALAAVKELAVETVRGGEDANVIPLAERRNATSVAGKPRFHRIPAGNGLGPHMGRRCAVRMWALAGWTTAEVLNAIGHDATNDHTLFRFYDNTKRDMDSRASFVSLEEQIDAARSKYQSAAALVERDRVLAEPRARAKELAARRKAGRAAHRLKESPSRDERAA